jgi:FMN phosphatase YigB (HAD superfamily)
MLDTFLFDLDGTLLPMDTDQFVRIYFSEMGVAFHDVIEPKLLASHIWNATHAMVENTEYKTNETAFMEKFSQLIEGDLEFYQNRFTEFYDQGFLKTRASVIDTPLIQESVHILKSKGYNLVITTNPIFPEKAILHRIRWAGLDPGDFSYITSFERNHYCKPQLQFYEELLAEIGKKPGQCIMVGNDVQDDLVVGKLGMKTFLITNYLINKTNEDFSCTYQGTYEDFHRFVSKLNIND